MDDLKVCRICLRTDKFAKYYRLEEFFLKCYYEEITTIPVTNNDGLPKYFCFQCSAILNKYHFFKEKCCFAQNTLKQMARTAPLTYNKICNMYSRQMPIIRSGTIEILKSNKNVKTYNFEYKEQTHSSKTRSKRLKKESDSESDCYENDVDFYPDSNSSDDDVPIKELSLDLKKDNSGEVDIFEEFNEKVEEPVVQEPLEKEEVKETQEIPKILKNLLSKQSKPKKSTSNRKKSSSKVVNDPDKKYKFTKAKDGKLKALQFLDSGFWRKLTLSEEEAMKEFQAKGQNEKYLRAAHKCTDCHKPFSQKNMLDRHLLRKHGESVGSLVCRFCKVRFRRACFLSKHMKQHLTKYECLRCNLVCNVETTALFHEEYHSGVIRKCPHCDKEFKHLSTFYTHLRTHRSKHMCSLCGESFVSPLGLRQHKRLKHVIVPDNQVTDAENNTYCEVCKITFETKEAYTKHLLHSAMHTDDFTPGGKAMDATLSEEMFEEGEDKIDDKDSDTPKQLYERKSKVEKTLSAVRKSNLPAVAGTGWTKKPTTCQHCGKHFASQSACRKHHLAEHLRAPFYTEKDRVICEICGASLAPGSVAAHLNQHTRRKIYTCETCGRSFTTNHVLRNHMATHTGERNYACNICGKRFTQNGSLSLHYRTVHLKQPYIRDRKKKIDDTNIGAFFNKQEFL
ncbi:unnamed protein product [Chilo suppressalis]|uniref:Protein krueppel n=1 Tax=Chilo suppressalis TaxID=168631 RepID=A0ABN8B7M8_CHISP|nr:unnamed protein product [Chilo suppressalis]